MPSISFDSGRPLDLILLGRVAIDLNPVDYYQSLAESTTYKKYLGGSPANIAVGLARLGKKIGFIARVSDDAFGDFCEETFAREGIDVSHIRRCTHGEKLGLTFTEIRSREESSILMYRNEAADLSLSSGDVDEAYIKSAKALLISGTALAQSPSREAALKAVQLAVRTGTPVFFDIDYRDYNWKSREETAVYCATAARDASLILGSREEYDLTESVLRPGMTDAESAAFWQGFRAKIVIIKHGRQGSAAYAADGRHYTVRPFPIQALKSFGGGDGYASAFLYGLFEGWDIPACLELGSASASLLVASHGCGPFMPTLDRIRAFMDGCREKYGEMVTEG